MSTPVSITDGTAGLVICDAQGSHVDAGLITLEDDAELKISAPGGWRVLICNLADAGSLEVEAVVQDASERYEAHHLKPKGGWSLGWSVYLEGDPGDIGVIRLLQPVVASPDLELHQQN